MADHWSAVQYCPGTSATFILSTCGLVIAKGGLPALDRWNEEIEHGTRKEVHEKISCALTLLVGGGEHSACDDLIAGFDQWRLLQERYKFRTRTIRRAPYVVLLTLSAILAAFTCWNSIEKSEHLYSALSVAVVAGGLCIAAYDWLPLVYLAYKCGIVLGKERKE